jgi:heme/copper-type cytochrome/quinol oxidase subunit 4
VEHSGTNFFCFSFHGHLSSHTLCVNVLCLTIIFLFAVGEVSVYLLTIYMNEYPNRSCSYVIIIFCVCIMLLLNFYAVLFIENKHLDVRKDVK